MCNQVYECGHNGGYYPFTMFIELNKTILNTYLHPVPKHFFRIKYVYRVYTDTHEI